MQTVVETPFYIRKSKIAGLTEDERVSIVTYLAAHPTVGNEIKGTGGARKVRFAAKGKGKSGGYRVITFCGGADIPVFLLNVFVKNQKVDLTQAERNELKGVLSNLAEAYRKKEVHHA